MSMKKLRLTIIICFLCALSAMAQVNPKAGYIITNEGDTVHGTIDYRSDTRNSRTCDFKADGAESFRSYSPGEIAAYRLLEGGAYYVSRAMSIEGETKTVFAEYLLSGGMSLYHHKENRIDYYCLVDADGRTANIRETHDMQLATDERREAQRQKLAEAGQLFGRSPETLEELWKMGEVTPAKLTAIVNRYNRQHYGDKGRSTEFSKTSDGATWLITRLRIEAGMGLLSMDPTPHKENKKELDLSGTAPLVGIGVDIVAPRLSQSLVFQAMASFSPNKATGDNTFGSKKEAEVKFNDLALNLGAMYRFLPEGRLSPLVRAGVALDYLFGYETDNWEGYFGNSGMDQHHSTASFGFYGGAGADMAVGKHRLSLTANYVYRNFGHYSMKAPMFTICLGWVF